MKIWPSAHVAAKDILTEMNNICSPRVSKEARIKWKVCVKHMCKKNHNRGLVPQASSPTLQHLYRPHRLLYHFNQFWLSHITGWVWLKLNICPQSHLQVAEPKNQIFSGPLFWAVKWTWPNIKFGRSLAILCHTTTGRPLKFIHPVPCHTPCWTNWNGTVSQSGPVVYLSSFSQDRLQPKTSIPIDNECLNNNRAVTNTSYCWK